MSARAEETESKESAEFRREVRAWIAANKPAHPGFKLPQTFLEVESERQFDFLRAWQRKVYEAGYLGLDWPAEYGGKGDPLKRQRIVSQEVGRAGAPFFVNVIGLQWAGPTILAYGTEEQKKRYLGPILSAEEIWCQGFSEPGSGSDLASLRTRAEPDGEHFRIYGQKVWTTFGPWADWIFVLARTDMEDRYGGITFFLMPIAQKGVEMRGIRQITGEAEFGEVFLDGGLARREHIVGKIGEGWRVAMTLLGYERGGATLSHPAEYDGHLAGLAAGLKQNGQLGRPDVREKLGRLVVENEVMRANGLRNLANIASGNAPGPESSIEKIFWSEYAKRLTDTALELLGPQAQLLDHHPSARPDVNWAYEYLWTRAGTIYSGSSEIQRNIIAKRVLRMPTK
jgi:alkylation response protein AidB-like acyl-CoA dehydrogenase